MLPEGDYKDNPQLVIIKDKEKGGNEHVFVSSIACGGNHNLALTRDGEVRFGNIQSITDF